VSVLDLCTGCGQPVGDYDLDGREGPDGRRWHRSCRWWRLTHTGARPPVQNAEVRSHRMRQAGVTDEWRTAFAWLARQAKVPRLEAISVIATPLYPDRRSRPDVGAVFPAVKAAIDGLVDAGVIPNDTEDRVVQMTMTRAGTHSHPGLELTIYEEPYVSSTEVPHP